MLYVGIERESQPPLEWEHLLPASQLQEKIWNSSFLSDPIEWG